MRNNVFQAIAIAMTSALLISSSVNNRTYQTECVTIETDGYVTVKIWDTKKGARYKIEQARKDAIHSILYSGIADGDRCATQPPVLNNIQEQDNFMEIEKSFFDKNGKWSMFTRNTSTETALPRSLGTKNWKVYQVSIAKNELRKYLEEEKVIKSLKTGF